MSDRQNYGQEVELIKTVILQSQYNAACSVNEKQLMLYYGIGKFISFNSRNGFWGRGAIDAISDQLGKELPGLKGFSARNLRNMRTFYEEWAILDSSAAKQEPEKKTILADASAKSPAISYLQMWQTNLPSIEGFPMADFLHVGFSHHILILSKVKGYEERLFYIKLVVSEQLSHDALNRALVADEYHHQGSLPNNFLQTLVLQQST